ncbi:MAG TPA: hypothetical protein VEC14_15005 [Reyranellaceae bacterium]|nr:hypothetical protein [Reyranellaceae bacterium]
MSWMMIAGRFLKANWLPIVIGLAVLGAIWKIDRNGYNRAKNEVAAEQAEAFKRDVAIVAVITRKMDQRFAEIDAELGRRITSIDHQERNLAQPILRQELARDPGLASRQCLTPRLLDAINIARGLSLGEPSESVGAAARSVPGPAGPH